MREIINTFKRELSGFRLLYNIIDVLIVAFILYIIFAFLKKHNMQRLIKYIVASIICITILASKALELKMVGSFAPSVIVFIFISVVILLSPEIKRLLFRISSPKMSKEVYSITYDCSEEELKEAIDDIVRACQNMSKKNIGALIVIAPSSIPIGILESGTKMDSYISNSLLECIFNTKAPLHDGAVFIHGNKILAAGCFLPLTQSTSLDQELGTRHRAAIGVTETNNVISIIVSEETGVISVASEGKILRYLDTDMLRDTLGQVYGLKATAQTTKKNGERVARGEERL